MARGQSSPPPRKKWCELAPQAVSKQLFLFSLCRKENVSEVAWSVVGFGSSRGSLFFGSAHAERSQMFLT